MPYRSLIAAAVLLPVAIAGPVRGEAFDPSDPGYTGRRGATIHVSKLGDDSDGTSWEKAFRTIQGALLAVPDAEGGHRILIRPDTYVEANLYPAHPGASGAYNLLVGDVDGSLGSGATGWAIIDTGVPDKTVRQKPAMEPGEAGGNPGFEVVDSPNLETGLKSVDWWGPWKCDPSFSAIGWDRWIFRGLYATGSEGGMGWDLTTKVGSEFSAIVDGCVGLGRFAGAAAIGQKLRPGEPVVFRGSYFACLDVWGDAGGVYVRSHDPEMPASPGVIFEDCTIVGPDNALQVGYPGFEGYSRVKFQDCRLIVVNFSQPHGTPATGIVYSDLAGKYLHVEFEDCDLMGFKALGAKDDLFTYEVRGKVRAYVQYRQPVPDGFERTPLWPTDLFRRIGPPDAVPRPEPREPRLVKVPIAWESTMENAPVVFQGRPLIVLNYRDDTKNNTDEYKASMFLRIRDLVTGSEVARFAEGHSFASAFVEGPELHVFGSEGSDRDWFQSIWHFRSTDLKGWTRTLAIPREGDEHLFNVSVAKDDRGYVMAYESNLPVQFCFKFARSSDLETWEKMPGLVFSGVNREYSACPVLRWIRPWYYVIYTREAVGGKAGWVPFVARSRDLETWELSPRNPILEAIAGEGVNNSDVDLLELDGSTWVFYATGDQQTWGALRVATFPGTLAEFFESRFPAGVPTVRATSRVE